MGFISHEGPTEESRLNTHFAITFKGEGWSEHLSEGSDQYTTPPDTTVITKVGSVIL